MCQTQRGHLRTSNARYDKTIRSASDARIRAGYVGGVPVSGPVDWEGIRWRFWIWNPWWLLGGILFLLTALQYQRSLRATTKAPTLTTL